MGGQAAPVLDEPIAALRHRVGPAGLARTRAKDQAAAGRA